MAQEIERKFLVEGDGWRKAVIGEHRLVQGYLAHNERSAIRVRIKDQKALLTIKSAVSGITRAEFEYEIPMADAEVLLHQLARQPLIDKTRYLVRVGDHTWELDLFRGDNEGLVMAEIELESADESFEIPNWAGREVSDDRRYYNANLAEHPFKAWGK